MELTNSGLSASDVLAMTRDNDGFGGVGLIILLFIFLIGIGGNGFGYGNGVSNFATTEYVANEFTQRDINSGFQNTNNLISSGFADTATGLCGVKSEVLENRYANQLSACQTQRDILTHKLCQI